MESIEKLRELACDMNAKEIIEHVQLYPTCVFKDEWLDAWQREFGCCVEAIEAEIERDYMRLPVDADGVPIHMGDTVEGKPLGGSRVKGSVTTYHIHDNDEPDSIYIQVDCGNGTWTIRELQTECCHHAKTRTIEDVLRELVECAEMPGEKLDDGDIEAFADEIRKMFGGDAS